MKVEQALVAIGGSASRLRGAGVDVPLSKSFLQVRGKPLLHWCLVGLHAAGIRRVVLAGNESEYLHEAELALDGLPFSFSAVNLYRDPGLGVHGLPWQARRYLDDTFLFECGHSVMQDAHYKRLAEAKARPNIVFSAFEPHVDNRRQPVYLRGGRVELRGEADEKTSAVAHPFVLDKEYVNRLPSLRFDIDTIIRNYSTYGQLRFVMSAMPPEFDTAAEMRSSLPQLEAYVDSIV